MPVKASFFDRLLREVSPERAANRLYRKHQFDMMAQGGVDGAYDAANSSRYRNKMAFQRSLPGDEESALGSYDRDKVRLECRDLYRNSEIASGAVDRIPSYTIWTGLWPQAHTADEQWNKDAEDWWRQIYSNIVDYRQRPGVDIVTFQKLVIRHRILDGECGFVLMKNGQLQPIEAERIATPQTFTKPARGKVVQGIHLSNGGIPVAYYIKRRDDNGRMSETFDKVRRESFIHCMEPKRFDQVRGVPDLAPMVNKLRDYDKTDENVLNKIKNDGQRLLKRFYTDGVSSNDVPRNSYTKMDSDDKDPTKVEKHEWGQIAHMRLGEDMDTFESKTPNGQYTDYMEHELKAIASAFGIPYEYMTLIFTEGSFSAQRAAMLHARHAFTEWHSWLVRVFLNRLWNWQIAKQINLGVLAPAPLDKNGVSEWHKVEWSVPALGWVDPDKQAKADDANLKSGRTSLKASIKGTGRDRDDVFSEIAEDIKAAKRKAKEINDDTELEDTGTVTWRDVADIGAKTPGTGVAQ